MVVETTAATGFRAGVEQHPPELGLEHAPIGGTGQGVAFGEVLDVPQQDGVAQVERVAGSGML